MRHASFARMRGLQLRRCELLTKTGLSIPVSAKSTGVRSLSAYGSADVRRQNTAAFADGSELRWRTDDLDNWTRWTSASSYFSM